MDNNRESNEDHGRCLGMVGSCALGLTAFMGCLVASISYLKNGYEDVGLSEGGATGLTIVTGVLGTVVGTALGASVGYVVGKASAPVIVGTYHCLDRINCNCFF